MSQRQIENTIPVLPVRDLGFSMAFYRSVLGFEMEWQTDAVCSVARDGCSIMLQQQDEVTGGTVWIGVEDDSIFAEILSSDATIVQQPTNQPWAYEMKIADPDGNVLWLGTGPKS